MKKKILITSALPYVNNIPHLGNIIGCVLSADVFARFCRSKGYECIYICGTDEYGTATETKAREMGVSPKEICDKYYPLHKKVYDWFNISFDYFGRTSTPKQTEIAQDIFLKLYKNGYVFKDEVEQFFCEKCNMFLADRYIEGTCPFCGYDEARGDQCDNCGKLLEPAELINPHCKICGNTPVLKKSKHLFLDLPKLKDKLLAWINKTSKKGRWSHNSLSMTMAWIRDGLKPRAITRDLTWGTPLPLEEYKNKVFYVWFDAPIGYISITANYTEDWEKWWKNPEEVLLYQFMGKDNVPFHTVIFPATLIGTGENYTLLYHINTTEYLNYESGKFSKSRNIGVFGDSVMKTGIPSDVWRYYLLINRPEKSDTVFKWKDFQEKVNKELIANLGNLVNRVVSFIERYFNGEVPGFSEDEVNRHFRNQSEILINKITEHLENVELKDGLKEIMSFSKQGNQFFQTQEPWKTIKNNKKSASTTLYVLVNYIKDISILIEPYLPETSKKIRHLLNIDKPTWSDLGKLSIKPGHKIKPHEPLFKKLENKEIEKLRKRFSGESGQKENMLKEEYDNREDIEKFDFRVALIKSVKQHPDADKLYIMTLDVGGKTKEVVAGFRSIYTEKELIGKKVIYLANLQKAKLRGFVSEGMVLAAEDNENVEILEAPNSEPGTRVIFNDNELDKTPEKEVSFKEFQKLKLTIAEDKSIVWKELKMHTNNETIKVKNIKTGGRVL